MTKRTVTNGGDRTVVTMGTEDFAVAIEPDELLVLKTKKVEKFNNFVKSDKLVLGTSHATTIGGESIWIKRGWLGPPSEPTHGPGYLGTKNGALVAEGEAEALTASTNVKAEGFPVVRVKDKTWQNRRNTKGEVMTQVVLMDLSGDGGDESGGSALARGARGGTKKPSGGQGQRGKALLPPSPDTPVDACSVLEVAMACQRGRRDSHGFLQVVAFVRETIRLEGRVDGRCGQSHPVWTVVEGPLHWGAPQPGTQSSVLVAAPAPKTIENETIAQRQKTKYRFRCEGCRDPKPELRLEVFEPGRRDVTLVDGNGWWRYVMVVAETGAEFAGAEKLDTGQDATVPVVDGLRGKLAGNVQVVEHVDHRVYVKTLVEMRFDPLLELAFKFDFYALLQDLLVGAASGGTVSAGARAARRGKRTGFGEKLKKAYDDIKQGGINKLKELEDRYLDLTEELGELLGGEPDEGRRERARQLLRDHLSRMGQTMADVMPFQFPKTELEGQIKLRLAIDVTFHSPPPDAADPTLTGSGVTGSYETRLKVASKQRFGIAMLRVPCECNVRLDGTGSAAREVYYEPGWSVGIQAGKSPLTTFVDASVTCGGTNLVSVGPISIALEVETPRVQLFPEVRVK